MMILLTILTAILVVVFFLVLAYGLIKISSMLRSIGGTPTSFLAKIRYGLRAIETETGHLTPQVVRLNDGLTQVGAGLKEVDRNLVDVIEAAVKQERYQ
ncbi:MAG: hypothetical protein IIA77_02270 [Proteobacteria bacterium]|nr:hypothetical protein [Pseudomonadota bacterium]MCH8261863.1 hypothetical protein [Pseudomonadota bacterium]